MSIWLSRAGANGEYEQCLVHVVGTIDMVGDINICTSSLGCYNKGKIDIL